MSNTSSDKTADTQTQKPSESPVSTYFVPEVGPVEADSVDNAVKQVQLSKEKK